MDRFSFAKGVAAREEDVTSAWIAWATEVYTDLNHLRPPVILQPPPEMRTWVETRKLMEKVRRPNSRPKAADLALLLDVGEWMMEVVNAEASAAATLECLLHAAWLLWDANGRQRHPWAAAIYDHIHAEWNVVPAPLPRLTEDREARRKECQALLRDEDLVPSWFLNGGKIPDEALEEDAFAGAVTPNVTAVFDG
jgi:hypothetical protein